jgi:hypothetical protein
MSTRVVAGSPTAAAAAAVAYARANLNHRRRRYCNSVGTSAHRDGRRSTTTRDGRNTTTTTRAVIVVTRSSSGSVDVGHALQTFFASESPIDGLGALTGYWYLDVFAAMNVALLLALIFITDRPAR